MLSKYFEIKTNTEKFENDLRWSMGEIKDKKVLIYGAGEGFLALNKKYNFNKELNVVAIADKNFETENYADFYGMKAIKPADITKEDFDVILTSNENAKPILDFIFNELCIENKNVRTIFNEEIKDERINTIYLNKFKFEKTLPKLIKKMKNKKVVLYGAGAYLELIKKYYDISGLNVIAVADKKYEIYNEEKEFLGYKTCAPSEIAELKPDYVLISTKYYINIFEYLTEELLKGTKIKVKPLVKKSFMALVKEVWNI